MRFSLPLIALCAIGAAITAPVAAAPQAGEEVVTVRIDMADLDITTSEGRAALEARIDARLREACTITNRSPYGYGRPIRDEACIAKARTEALAKAERVAAARQRGGRQAAAN
ncbi:MAG: UrcA family protein [Erythrobacter sp.]